MEAKISEISSPVDIGDEFGEMPENTGVIDDSAAASTEDEDLLVSEKHSEKIIFQLNNSEKMVQNEDEKMLLDDQNSSLAEKQDIETNLNNSESYLECRICRSTDEEPLISPCKCSGSSKWIHQSCLVQWFQISRATKCELCSEKIIIKKFVKPVREWKRPNSRFGSCSKVDLWYAFVTLFSLGTIIGFAVFHSYVGPEEGMETTVVFVAIYVLCTLMIALRVRYFYHWCTRRNPFWDEWRVLNQEWDVQQDGARPPETLHPTEESVV